ncbi:MAG: release factor glutamine methyltransferase [Candidatus Sumerlaeota bacterium]|nr:release factor glutamine methyltransferase [Candidatus Sumerlaeota bacterium]
MAMSNVGDLVIRSAEWLGKKGVDSPRLDAELLLAHVLGCNRLRLYMDWHKPLTELEVSAYRDILLERGQRRVPVARLLGSKEFYGRAFRVTPAVFVPRPETEGVVDRAVALLESEGALRVERPVVFDVGTGSGCIAVTIAAEVTKADVIASDVSEDALKTARHNAGEHHVQSRVTFRHGSGFAGYEGVVHLIATNPPYIAQAEIAGLEPEVREHDPMPALDGGADGLDALREIIAGCSSRLVPGGWIVAELGEDQEEGALSILKEAGLFDERRMERDLEGRPRYLMGRRRSA